MKTITREDVMRTLESEGCLLATGLEKALIGYAQQFNKITALYDFDLCVKELTGRGMPEDEAVQYLEGDMLGVYVGEKTPSYAFLHRGADA